MPNDPENIGMEPLLNQGGIGSGTNKKPGMIPIDTVGVAAHRVPLSITNTDQEVTITDSMRTIEMQNVGSKIVYYGGKGVTSSNGIKLFPNNTKIFSNVKDTFSIYLVTDGTDTATVRVVEYD